MFCIKRTLAVVVALVLTIPACAFTFSYGSLFEVKEVKNKDGALQLPLTRKKYKNVKVLSKQLYGFLQACTSDCAYEINGAELNMQQYRAAASRADMWIAQVSVNEEILLTFLVFKNENGFHVKFPEVVQFKSAVFKKNLQKYIAQFAAEHV